MSESAEEHLFKQKNSDQRPKTYFQLVQKVGDGGRYQLVLFIIFSVIWFVTGFILMSTAFLFLNKNFNCQEFGLMSNNCDEYVCSLPKADWVSYEGQKDNNFQSLATDFQRYYCEDSYIVDLASSCTYFGAFIGYILISFFADNYGRRASMLIAWTTTTIGTIIVASSVNIYMASFGLFLSGAGSDAAINICFFFFGELVEDKKRQQYSVFVQVMFTLGAMTITVLFYFFPNWRIVWIIGATVPAIFGLIVIAYYVQETPQFLIRKGVNETLRAMNRIGWINFKRRQILEEEDVQNVINCSMATEEFSKMITPIDLIRFPSLRQVTINCSIISFMTYAMYYGPTLIIADVGFDIYISSIMIQFSQLVIFLPCYLYIEQIRRQAFGILLFLIATVMAGILIFMVKPDDCQLCVESILELVLVVIFRMCISFFFCFFQMYVCELYPSRARGLGSGIVSAVGCVASTVSPILLGMLKRNGINVMSFFVLFGIIAMASLTMLTETKGVPLKEEIQEIELQKQKRRSHISTRKSKVSGSAKSLITQDNVRSKKDKSENE